MDHVMDRSEQSYVHSALTMQRWGAKIMTSANPNAPDLVNHHVQVENPQQFYFPWITCRNIC